MKYLFRFLGLVVVAVIVGVAGKFNTGYVQLVYAPYRVEMSLSFAVVAATLGFFALYTVIRLAVAALGLPSQVRAYRLRRQRNRGRSSLHQALSAFFEGNYARAEKLAAQALKLRESPGVSAVIAPPTTWGASRSGTHSWRTPGMPAPRPKCCGS
jgi:HemY protein